jgi:hypothetical protein
MREEVSLAMSADHFLWGNLTPKAVDTDENRVCPLLVAPSGNEGRDAVARGPYETE